MTTKKKSAPKARAIPAGLSRFDAAEHLRTDEEIAMYLTAMAEDGNPALIAKALGTVIRARNLSALSRKTGLSRPGIRTATSGDGNPTLETIIKLTDAIGVQMTFAPRKRELARAG